MSRPFPTSIPQFQTVFPDEQTCRKYLVESRWPDGFRCQRCGHEGAWGNDIRLVCRVCRHETTVTADTILHRSHLPLLTWFWSAYLVSTTSSLNARGLGKALGSKNHVTRWSIMNRLRRSMSSLDLPKLTGVVEADEMVLGGFQPGKTGFSGANKTTVLVLVERISGRTRLVVIPDRKGKTLVSLISKLVAPGSTVITDGHVGYRGLTRAGYTWIRIPHPVGGLKRGGNRATPNADGAISLFKRWLIGTYNKPPKDLTRYLGEFCFRLVCLQCQRGSPAWQGLSPQRGSKSPLQGLPADGDRLPSPDGGGLPRCRLVTRWRILRGGPLRPIRCCYVVSSLSSRLPETAERADMSSGRLTSADHGLQDRQKTAHGGTVPSALPECWVWDLRLRVNETRVPGV